MIYFFHGTDIDKARSKAHDLANSLRKKKPEASYFVLDVDNFDVNTVEEYVGGQGLFSAKYIVFVDRLSEDKEIKEQFLDLIKNIAESENIFIILEGKLDKASSTKIEKKSEKFFKTDLLEKVAKQEYNAFALADAFGKRNKKETWVLYRTAIDNGEAPEALHGMLFWKIKSIFLAGGDYNWKKEELLKIMDELITIYHEVRRGKFELETGLEAFILS
jgi:DNA polymerase III delta subunit